MADKIAKLLAKLPAKQVKVLVIVMSKIIQGNLDGLDIKSLKGQDSRYRVRVGNYRIIFAIRDDGKHVILLVAKRNEKTYKDI